MTHNIATLLALITFNLLISQPSLKIRLNSSPKNSGRFSPIALSVSLFFAQTTQKRRSNLKWEAVSRLQIEGVRGAERSSPVPSMYIKITTFELGRPPHKNNYGIGPLNHSKMSFRDARRRGTMKPCFLPPKDSVCPCERTFPLVSQIHTFPISFQVSNKVRTLLSCSIIRRDIKKEWNSRALPTLLHLCHQPFRRHQNGLRGNFVPFFLTIFKKSLFFVTRRAVSPKTFSLRRQLSKNFIYSESGWDHFLPIFQRKRVRKV